MELGVIISNLVMVGAVLYKCTGPASFRKVSVEKECAEDDGGYDEPEEIIVRLCSLSRTLSDCTSQGSYLAFLGVVVLLICVTTTTMMTMTMMMSSTMRRHHHFLRLRLRALSMAPAISVFA